VLNTANKQQHDAKKQSANFMRGDTEVQPIQSEVRSRRCQVVLAKSEAQKSLRESLGIQTFEGNMPGSRLLRLVGGPHSRGPAFGQHASAALILFSPPHHCLSLRRCFRDSIGPLRRHLRTAMASTAVALQQKGVKVPAQTKMFIRRCPRF